VLSKVAAESSSQQQQQGPLPGSRASSPEPSPPAAGPQKGVRPPRRSPDFTAPTGRAPVLLPAAAAKQERGSAAESRGSPGAGFSGTAGASEEVVRMQEVVGRLTRELGGNAVLLQMENGVSMAEMAKEVRGGGRAQPFASVVLACGVYACMHVAALKHWIPAPFHKSLSLCRPCPRPQLS
jgi:hypothetical protein